MTDHPSGDQDWAAKLNELEKGLPQDREDGWMTKFDDLQKKQVEALILQNENQKLQLEILSYQLKVENERNSHRSKRPEGPKEDIQDTSQVQSELSPPNKTPLNSIQGFALPELGSDINQSIQRFPDYNPEASQGTDIFSEQDQNFIGVQRPEQINAAMELPDISNMDATDGRLMMALCYNMQPPPLQTAIAPDPFTPDNRRTEDREICNYGTSRGDQSSSNPAKTRRRPSYHHNSIIRTPVSPMESPRIKRVRVHGDRIGLPECITNSFNYTKESTTQCETMGEALQTYAANIEKLASALTRKDLEECIMELALHEQDDSMALKDKPTSGIASKGLVRSTLLKKCRQDGRKVVFNKDVYPMSMGLEGINQLGAFKKLPLELLIQIITFLPLGTALRFILSVCKSFRALMSAPALWNYMIIDPRNQGLSTDGFIRLVRTLPETSIRYFGIDTAYQDAGAINEIVDLLIKGKQFGITSLHISGKKLAFSVISNVVRRLWADKITVFSLTDITQSKVDSDLVVKQILSLMPNLRKLRMENGTWDARSLRSLSCLHGQLRNGEMNRLIGDNRLTHLSFSGPKTMVSWNDLTKFGRWFPELEELFIQSLYGDEAEWIKNYANGPAKDWVEGAVVAFDGAKYKYRTPNCDDIKWVPISRLKYFGCGGVCEQSKKYQVKVFEEIHAAYLWRLLRGSCKTLERLELSRGAESPKDRKGSARVLAPLPRLIPASLREIWSVDFPKLTHIFLGFWELDWEQFTAIKPVNRGEFDSSEPALGLTNVKKIIFWGCIGMPAGQTPEGGKAWVHQIKKNWGNAEVIDGDYEAVKDNKGMGTW